MFDTASYVSKIEMSNQNLVLHGRARKLSASVLSEFILLLFCVLEFNKTD